MNTPVNFELAKLLKEKGFDEWTKTWHQRGDGVVGCVEGKRDFYNRKGDVYTSAPTISEVVMWLYEKHGIWIVINPHKGEDDLGKPFMEFDPEVWSFTNKCILHNTKLLYFNSPIEAYEAAIEYTLNNLI